jgi:hypothetical protein
MYEYIRQGVTEERMTAYPNTLRALVESPRPLLFSSACVALPWSERVVMSMTLSYSSASLSPETTTSRSSFCPAGAAIMNFTPLCASSFFSTDANPSVQGDSPPKSPQRHQQSPRRRTLTGHPPFITSAFGPHIRQGSAGSSRKRRCLFVKWRKQGRTASQKRHQLPARPPPSGSLAESWHCEQLSSTMPMISTRDATEISEVASLCERGS